MRTLSLLTIISSFGYAIIPTSPARAQAIRTWVSGVGDDVNPCSRTAPCKTFAGAISKTAAGGEISILDPGGFGAVTIIKSISITNDGAGEAGILAAGTNGIVISAGASDVVNLRGLVIDGAHTGTNGIRFLSGKALNIQNCWIKNFGGSGVGINFIPNGSAFLTVSDTTISSNGFGSSGGGVFVGTLHAGTNPLKVSLSRAQLLTNGFGLKVDGTGGSGTAFMTVHDSVVTTNSGNGVWAISPNGGSPTRIMVDRSTIINNDGTGILTDGVMSVALVNNAVITGNGTGMQSVNSASLESYKNNGINLNVGNDGAPTLTIPLQ